MSPQSLKAWKAHFINNSAFDLYDICLHFVVQHVDCFVYKHFPTNSKQISNNLGQWQIRNGHVVNPRIAILNPKSCCSAVFVYLGNNRNSDCNGCEYKVSYPTHIRKTYANFRDGYKWADLVRFVNLKIWPRFPMHSVVTDKRKKFKKSKKKLGNSQSLPI